MKARLGTGRAAGHLAPVRSSLCAYDTAAVLNKRVLELSTAAASCVKSGPRPGPPTSAASHRAQRISAPRHRLHAHGDIYRGEQRRVRWPKTCTRALASRGVPSYRARSQL